MIGSSDNYRQENPVIKLKVMTKQIQDDATFVPLFFNVNTAFFFPNVHDTGRYDARQQLSGWNPQSAWF
jgi:hypothetical protein